MDLPAELLDIRAIALDMDGTLAGADSSVTPRSLRALGALQAAGVEPILVTGRMAASAERVMRDSGVDGYIVVCNGAIVRHVGTNELLARRFMEPRAVLELIEFAETSDVRLMPFSETEMFATDPGPDTAFLAETQDDVRFRFGPLRDIDLNAITKVMISAPPARLDAITPGLLRVAPTSVRSLDDFAEVSHPLTDKWAGLGLVLDRLGLTGGDLAGVGDGENDLAWMRHVAWPMAPSNARSKVQRAARLHLGHHDDEAVADLLEQLVAARAARLVVGS